MRKILLSLCLIVAFAAVSLAQTEGLRVEDLFRIKRVGDPQISSNGQTIAYSITSYDRETSKRSSQIWLTSLDGSQQPRLIPDSSEKDSRPRWSPDGRTLAFVSNREGESQIWVVDASGGRARKLTTISTEAGDLVWSPKGDNILFVSEIYPDCMDDDCNKQKLQAVANNKVKAKVADRLLYRHWNAWKDGKRTHVFIVSASGGVARDLTPGDFDAPPFSLGGPDNYTFSPDGQEVCFSRNTDKDEALSTNNDLFIVPISGGKAKRITTENKGSDTHPSYSPDGRYIAYRSQERAGFEADRFRLMLYDRQSGRTRSISEKLDRSIEELVWSPDSKTIYFTAEDNGYTPIYALDVQSQEIRQLTERNSNGELSITPDGRQLIFTRSSMSQPSEVFALRLGNLKDRPLTETNEKLLSKRKLIEGEDVYSRGADGAKVHSILTRPVDFDPRKKYPMVVLIHGGPQGAWLHNFGFRWNANIYAAAGYVVLMPNPRGSTGYGQKFTDEISGDWGGKVYEDIMNAVDNAISLGFVDPNRIGAAGGSFGGYMVNWILGHNNRFKALVSHAGVYNLVSMYGTTEELWFTEWEFRGNPWNSPEQYSKFSPHNFVKNFRTPTLVIHGELDYRVPVTEGIQLFTALQRQNVPSKMIVFPDEGHWILKPHNSEMWYRNVLEWFDKYVK
jgi:dipeptidyl aminopeptidase/acylaminoacyl peptidase